MTLEHQYVATLLAALLVGDPTVELGDRVALQEVRLQAGDVSAVDDVVLEGVDESGVTCRASIGVRRDPKLTSKDTKSVPLIRTFLRVVIEHWPEVSAGRWSLTLTVAKARPVFEQVGELCALARSVPDVATWAEAVARPSALNDRSRGRLRHLRGLVTEASKGEASFAVLGVDELIWRLLSTLKVRVVQLEGSQTGHRTAAVAALRRSVADGTPASADSVFSHLCELAGAYATRGGRITVGMLRRELGAHALNRLDTQEQAWRILDRLGDRLRHQTRSTITTAGAVPFELDRADAAASLYKAVEDAAATGSALVITGEPDVGKSALAVRVSEELRSAGAVVVALSLSDLPASALDLEQALGGLSLVELFEGSATGALRLLFVDGCEEILEGKEGVFVALVGAALRAGFSVASVTRTDGSRHVRDVLRRVVETATSHDRWVGTSHQAAGGQTGDVREYVVVELTEPERAQLVGAVDGLTRLGADPRASWVLGRPGLVDALLRSGTSLEPGQLLCEADVYVAVWNGLVRRRDAQPPGTASPDDRSSTVVALAGHRLGWAGVADGQALRELRSDGVLRTESNSAFSMGPEFATDLYRDFGLCRLFLDVGWEPLKGASLPRWPMRAVRLACQARLSLAGPGGLIAVWRDLLAEFGELAAIDGARWLEVPYEALLTLGDARAAIGELWDELDSGDGLATLLRLANARYAIGSIGDPFVLAPVVEVAFCDRGLSAVQLWGSASTRQEHVATLVLAWLRGVAKESLGPNPLRRRIRDTILDQDRTLRDEFAIEALATLGVDLDDRAERWLRKVAADQPSSLYPVAEAPLTVVSMAQGNPDLLLDLSEAYYIEHYKEGRFGWHGMPYDDGIRDHRHGLAFGFGPPQAAWYYGPFFRLLNVAPRRAIAFINRMLNHAAIYRVADHPPRDVDSTTFDAWDDYVGIELTLTEASGRRHYVGDAHVWAWYRGTTVGPYACMSALLALERFIDYLYETADLSAQAICEALLEDCHNLAVPGLLAGFLIRHIEGVGSLLDPYLAEVEVWQLENARAAGEYGFRVRDGDADALAGHARRRFTPHDVVGHLVVNARLRGDKERLRALEEIGDRLFESAREAVAGFYGSDGQAARGQFGTDQSGANGSGSRSSAFHEDLPDEAVEFLAIAQSWAAEFRIDSYDVTRADGEVVIQFERPAEIARMLAPSTSRLETTQILYGLQSRYARKNETPDQWPSDTLIEDIATARAVLQAGLPETFFRPEDTLVAVAAAAIRAQATGVLRLPLQDLEWAAERVLLAVRDERTEEVGGSSNFYPMGGDRAAAIALPLLLLEPCDPLDLNSEALKGALLAVATSVFDEVRMSFATGCDLVWAAPCDADVDGTCRRHSTAWASVEQSLADCVMGPWDDEQQRHPPAALEPPYEETLPAARGDTLLVNRLRMPVVCAAGASNAACVSERARNLAGPLWDAHRRALDHWWREGYEHLSQRHHEPVARVLIEAAARGDRAVLDDHLRTFAENAHALQQFMDSFATIYSYDDRLRPSLTTVWVPSLRTVLDAIEQGADLRGDDDSWFDWAVASLIPTPKVEPSDLDPDATLNRCRETWAAPDAFAGLFDRWADLAKGEPRAAEAVAQLAQTAPIDWQATTGIDWLEIVLDGRHGEFANRVWFVTNWLGELRAAGAVTGAVIGPFHRVVDGLAAGGDTSAVALQLLDE